MNYSRHTDEELRKIMITNGALTGPVFEECVKRFLEQDPEAEYKQGYALGHEDGVDEGYAARELEENE